MTNISLYQAAANVQQKIALCVDEDGVLDIDAIELIESTFQERAVAVIAVYKGKGHSIDTLQAYRAEIDNQIHREQLNRERLHEYLKSAMLATGTEKIKSLDGLLTATLYRDRDESVEIDVDAVFPPELCNDPKPPGASKTKIKAAILAGEAVAGARIVRRDRLTIK